MLPNCAVAPIPVKMNKYIITYANICQGCNRLCLRVSTSCDFLKWYTKTEPAATSGIYLHKNWCICFVYTKKGWLFTLFTFYALWWKLAKHTILVYIIVRRDISFRMLWLNCAYGELKQVDLPASRCAIANLWQDCFIYAAPCQTKQTSINVNVTKTRRPRGDKSLKSSNPSRFAGNEITHRRNKYHFIYDRRVWRATMLRWAVAFFLFLHLSNGEILKLVKLLRLRQLLLYINGKRIENPNVSNCILYEYYFSMRWS